MSDLLNNILAKSDCNSVTISIPLNDLKNLVAYIIEDVTERNNQETAEKQVKATLTANEVCKILNVSKATLWHWKNKGILIPTKIGRKNLYKQHEINNLLIKNINEYE